MFKFASKGGLSTETAQTCDKALNISIMIMSRAAEHCKKVVQFAYLAIIVSIISNKPVASLNCKSADKLLVHNY